MDKLKTWGLWLGGGVVAVLAAWMAWTGPVAVWRVISHGTTTVWDHLEYPGRHLVPAADASPWSVAEETGSGSQLVLDGRRVELDDLLAETRTLGWVVVRSDRIVDQWHPPDHGQEETSMLFSATKSVFSLLVGAAIEDGLIDSVDDPISRYLPELSGSGGDRVTIEDLLRMDSGLGYVEDDNPFGIHVEFNYTPDLTEAILALRFDEAPDPQFRYKSGDNAVLGLMLDRVLGDITITGYLQRRLWDPLGMESGGVWSTDSEGGLERTWCCLAMSARDLARVGAMVQAGGVWEGAAVIPKEWITASAQGGYDGSRWPGEYEGSALANYGYQWWLTRSGALLALGKGGQYLYVAPNDTVIVRLGETQGDLSWVEVFDQIAGAG